MKTALLILNPAARGAHLLKAQLPAIAARLQQSGYSTQVVETDQMVETRPASPLPQLSSCDLVLACGGDGTAHHVVQALAHTRTPLGIIPLGTANALARNLRLPLHPTPALERLLTYAPVRIPLGQIVTERETRYFLLMAGCGPDGALLHGLSAAHKARFGRAAYYAHAFRLFFTRRWPAFEVTWNAADGTANQTTAIGLMASRVPDLGGIFTGLTSRARITSPTLHVQLLRPPATLSLPAWFALTGSRLPNPWLQTLDVEEIACRPIASGSSPSGSSPSVYAQADGEPLGTLPFRLRILPDALTLLMPPDQSA